MRKRERDRTIEREREREIIMEMIYQSGGRSLLSRCDSCTTLLNNIAPSSAHTFIGKFKSMGCACV